MLTTINTPRSLGVAGKGKPCERFSFNGWITNGVSSFEIGLERRIYMLRWALTFFILAIVAGVLGFGGIAADSAQIAKILFLVFLVLALVGFVTAGAQGWTRRAAIGSLAILSR